MLLSKITYIKNLIDVFNTYLKESLSHLNSITHLIFQGDVNPEFMDSSLTELYSAYDNILTYEDKLRFIDTFGKIFINNNKYHPKAYKLWFKKIITRIKEKEIDHVTIPHNSSKKTMLLSKITTIMNLIDSV